MNSWSTTIGLFLVGLASCTGAPTDEAPAPAEEPAPAEKPAPDEAPKPAVDLTNEAPDTIVIVTIDTLRADFMSYSGYPHPTTPYLDSLATGGTWFSHAFAPSSWTAPSMASLWTGVYPTTHGVQQGGMNPATRTVVVPILADELETLAESMQSAGYKTIGAPSNRLLAKDRGYAQGFDVYPPKAPFIEANKVNDMVRRQMQASYGDNWKEDWKKEKTFLWIHYYDPHLPWPAHEHAGEFATDYAENPSVFPTGRNAKQLKRGFPNPDAEDVRRFRAMYAQDVRFFDDQFKILAGELGLDDPNIALFVTSDHGEEILDHGDLSHGNTLFDDVVRVPLLARWTNGFAATGKVDTVVNLLDVYATVMETAGIAVPKTAQGHSLVKHLKTGKSDVPERTLLFEVDPPLDPKRPNQVGVTDGRWKLVRTEIPSAPHRLYDLSKELKDRVDVAADHPDVVARLKAELEAGLGALPAAENVEGYNADDALIEELRAMGYVQ